MFCERVSDKQEKIERKISLEHIMFCDNVINRLKYVQVCEMTTTSWHNIRLQIHGERQPLLWWLVVKTFALLRKGRRLIPSDESRNQLHLVLMWHREVQTSLLDDGIAFFPLHYYPIFVYRKRFNGSWYTIEPGKFYLYHCKRCSLTF